VTTPAISSTEPSAVPVSAGNGRDLAVPEPSPSAAAEMVVGHGYTLGEVQRLAGIAVASTPVGAGLDRSDVDEAAWFAIAEWLCASAERPAPGWLVVYARDAIRRLVRDERHHHGVPRDDPWAGQASMPRVAVFWHPPAGTSDGHADGVDDRVALRQVWQALREQDRQALAALAVTGDYQAAADALGLRLSTYAHRLAAARRRALALWHQGEAPSRPWRADRRVARRTACSREEGPAPSRRLAAARGHEAVRLRAQGLSWRQIADRLGYASSAGVARALTRGHTATQAATGALDEREDGGGHAAA
jgi:hypothetical protein